MSNVAKLVIVDDTDKYLLMMRSEHPDFGIDPDLPGGTIEDDETMVEGMIREVYEEAGVTISPDQAKLIYTGSEYSDHGTEYELFVAKLDTRPEIIMSWEHSSYEWLDRNEFLVRSRSAKDTYMHMVADKLK